MNANNAATAAKSKKITESWSKTRSCSTKIYVQENEIKRKKWPVGNGRINTRRESRASNRRRVHPQLSDFGVMLAMRLERGDTGDKQSDNVLVVLLQRCAQLV